MKHFSGGVTDHVLGFVIYLCCLISCSYAAFNSALAMQLHKAQGFVMPKSLFLAHIQNFVYVCVCVAHYVTSILIILVIYRHLKINK